DILSEYGENDNHFAGIMQNEFVILTDASDTDALVNKIQSRFDEQVGAFYTFSDADKGGIMLNPGTDSEEFVPIMQLVQRSEAINS
ncbi:MAG: hypothetical protein ACPG7F_11005, partial [Aggregatilineales bacterium]